MCCLEQDDLSEPLFPIRQRGASVLAHSGRACGGADGHRWAWCPQRPHEHQMVQASVLASVMLSTSMEASDATLLLAQWSGKPAAVEAMVFVVLAENPGLWPLRNFPKI